MCCKENIKDDKGRYHVAYIATVRITHQRSGVYREDCGSGDAVDKTLAAACGNALKGAITDAMKRAARHFGEKLGNSLYHDGFNANKAPGTLKDAFEALDVERAQTRFGFDKNNKMECQQQVTDCKNKYNNIQSHPASQNTSGGTPNEYVAKQASAAPTANKLQVKAEPTESKKIYTSNPLSSLALGANSFNSTVAKTSNGYDRSNEVPRAINVTNQYSNLMTPVPRGVCEPSLNVANILTTNSTNLSDPNQLNNINRTQKNRGSFPFSNFVATPAGGEENTKLDPNIPSSSGNGLDLPKRPGTSRGTISSQKYDTSNNGVTSRLNVAVGEGNDSVGFQYEQDNHSNSIQALKRKADGMESLENDVVVAKAAGVRNPYHF